MQAMDPDLIQHLYDLVDARARREAVDAEIAALVKEARREGGSWRDIGDALGISRQAAQQYYG